MMLPIALTFLAILLAYLSVRLIVVGPLRRTIARLQRENTNLQNNCDAWARSEAAVGLQLRNVQANLQAEIGAKGEAVGQAEHWHSMWKRLSSELGHRNEEMRTLEVAKRELIAEVVQLRALSAERGSKLQRAGQSFEELKRVARIFRAQRLEAQTQRNAALRDTRSLQRQIVALEEEVHSLHQSLNETVESRSIAVRAAEHFEKQVYELQQAKLTKSKRPASRARR